MANNKQSLGPNYFSYLTILLLGVVACMLFIIYKKRQSPQVTENKVEAKTEPTKQKTKAEKKTKTIKKKVEAMRAPKSEPAKRTQPAPASSSSNQSSGIKRTSIHSAIAMNYLKQSMSYAEGSSSLKQCTQYFVNYQLTEAKSCLSKDFSGQETHAEWYRALLSLTTNGLDSGTLKSLEKIASNSSHQHSKAATSLLSTIR